KRQHHARLRASAEPRVHSRMTGSLAAGVVRARWWVLGAWAVVGALAVVRAGGVAERLDVRGGSLRVTEASRVDELLATRFRQDIGETFLVLVTGPESFTGGRPRRLLDALCSALAREPYVREVTWFGSSGDSTLLSADRRTAVALVTLRVARADTVLRLVIPIRTVLRRAVAAFPEGAQYHAIVTGDTPLEETRSIGIGGLAVVAVAVALALTLVPALLAVLGRRVARRSASELAARRLPVNGRGIAASAVGPSRGLSRDRAAVLWEHWARALTRRPGLALLAGGLTLACLTAPVAWLRVGLPARHWWPSQPEAGEG